MPLWRYLGGEAAHVLPVPMMNVLNGGAHADNKVDFQEFMVVPVGAPSFCRGAAHRRGGVPRAEADAARRAGLATAVGDEGGFAPDLDSNEAALQVLVAGHRGGRLQARRRRGDRARPGHQRDLRGRRRTCSSTRAARSTAEEMAAYWADIVVALPGAVDRGRHGRGGLGRLEGADRARSASSVQLVGDDLFVTNTERLRRGIDARRGQLDPGQGEPDRDADRDARGRADRPARPATRRHVAPSGETEDTTIADLAVATGCGQIKTGAPSRSDRVAKYNQLLRIEEALGADASYPGRSAFRA